MISKQKKRTVPTELYYVNCYVVQGVYFCLSVRLSVCFAGFLFHARTQAHYQKQLLTREVNCAQDGRPLVPLTMLTAMHWGTTAAAAATAAAATAVVVRNNYSQTSAARRTVIASTS